MSTRHRAGNAPDITRCPFLDPQEYTIVFIRILGVPRHHFMDNQNRRRKPMKKIALTTAVATGTFLCLSLTTLPAANAETEGLKTPDKEITITGKTIRIILDAYSMYNSSPPRHAISYMKNGIICIPGPVHAII